MIRQKFIHKFITTRFVNEFMKPFRIETPAFYDRSIAYTLGDILKLMQIPLIFSLIAGLATCVTPKKTDQILIALVEEFVQIKGEYLALYLTVIMFGLCLLTCKSRIRIYKIFQKCISATSWFGYGVASVMAGVCVGLLLPIFIDLKVNYKISDYFYTPLYLILTGIVFQRFCYFSTLSFMKNFVSGLKYRSENSSFLVKEINLFLFTERNSLRKILGATFVLSGLGLLINYFYS